MGLFFYLWTSCVLFDNAQTVAAQLGREAACQRGERTVHEMARDEARHGKALQGLLNRYFK